MPRIQYEDLKIGAKTLAVIEQANGIIDIYRAQGYDLTLRQLYYQFVSRDLIPNKQSEYKRLGDIVSKGRRAGLIDWTAIVDRTRNLRSLGTWESPGAIVAAVAAQFRYDRWLSQNVYVEVWFEKDALMGVFERAANVYRVPFFSCRGYTSDSEVWSAARRLAAVRRGSAELFPEGIPAHKRDVVILHFGDHDPSGIDMTRDIRERLALFGAKVDVRRLALNMDQVDQYEPPPNPAKETDSRFQGYLAEYGDESWELDALEPSVLAQLVSDELGTLIEPAAWDNEIKREKRARHELTLISDHYQEAVEAVDDGSTPDEDDSDDGDES